MNTITFANNINFTDTILFEITAYICTYVTKTYKIYLILTFLRLDLDGFLLAILACCGVLSSFNEPLLSLD